MCLSSCCLLCCCKFLCVQYNLFGGDVLIYYAYHENRCVATYKICMQVLHKNYNYVWSFCRQTSIRNIWLNHIFLIHRDLGRFVTSGYIPCLSAKRSKTIFQIFIVHLTLQQHNSSSIAPYTSQQSVQLTFPIILLYVCI